MCASGENEHGFVIEQWECTPGGGQWTHSLVAKNDGFLIVRPVVPRCLDAGREIALWMEGHYVHYAEYATRIRIATVTSLPPSGG